MNKYWSFLFRQVKRGEMDAVVSQWRSNPSPSNIIILFPPSLSLPSRRCSTSIYIHLRLTRQISVLGLVFHYCHRLCDYKKSPSRAFSLRREPSGAWVLRRLGRSVNDFLAAAGDPVGKTRVRHQPVCPSRSLKTRPSGKPLRMLEKKKDVFVEVGFALALKTDGRHQMRHMQRFLSLYSWWDVLSDTHLGSSFRFIRSLKLKCLCTDFFTTGLIEFKDFICILQWGKSKCYAAAIRPPPAPNWSSCS